jgi:hypothetical protein
LAQITFVISPILHHRSPTNDFELSNLGEIIKDLILHSVRKVNIFFIRADVLEGKDCDAFFWRLYEDCRSQRGLSSWGGDPEV